MIHTLRSAWLGPMAGLVAIATIIGAAVLGPGAVRPLRIVGGAIGLVALPLSLVPILTLVRHGRPTEGESYLHTTVLVDSGLFSVVRHPQYLAYILFMLTFGLLAQHMVVTVRRAWLVSSCM